MDINNKYNEVYNFTNENVACIKYLYDIENSKVLSIVGSGDQYFSSILNGAKEVDLFDINPTSYLYLLLKFYCIRELTYEEFYDFLVMRNINNIDVQKKLISVLPNHVLKYYKHLIENYSKNIIFRKDGINLFSRKNQKYYFDTDYSVIPYFEKENYYKLKEKLKQIDIPKFNCCDALNLNSIIDKKYDILLMSNIYNYKSLSVLEYKKYLESLNIRQIQASYDWYGFDLDYFGGENFIIDIVKPSAPSQYNKRKNFVYSLKK